MLFYSAALALALLLGSPWWLTRMVMTERYREGLRERLGTVPGRLRAFAAGGRVVWVHAVSVGEVLAVSRLVAELDRALGEGTEPWRVVISTTTRTGQALARERFGAERVFYFPLDFAWAVRAYLRALRPAALVLAESEIWPRMLHECGRAGVPVAVVNARVSDRSFRRGMKVRAVWGRVLRGVSLWLVQSEEDGRRLVALGARAEAVQVSGNLKYDVRAPGRSRVAEAIAEAAAGRPVVVAGSTGEGEEELLVAAFYGVWAAVPRALLVIAPRHPERFGEVARLAEAFRAVRASELVRGEAKTILRQTITARDGGVTYESNTLVIVLDTIGDLASTYGIAHAAFVGGSLIQRGGHNPLEPAQFGVPVVMGSSFENFRDVVGTMRKADAIRIVGEGLPVYKASKGKDADGLQAAERIGAMREDEEDGPAALRRALQETLIELLTDAGAARAMGERGRQVFEEQGGATRRTVEALCGLVRAGSGTEVRA